MDKFRMYVDEVGNPDVWNSDNPNRRQLISAVFSWRILLPIQAELRYLTPIECLDGRLHPFQGK